MKGDKNKHLVLGKANENIFYSLGVIKPKAMNNVNGREGVMKSEKWTDVVYG